MQIISLRLLLPLLRPLLLPFCFQFAISAFAVDAVGRIDVAMVLATTKGPRRHPC